MHPADPADLTWEQYQLRRELGRKLGARGWLWPTAPAEFGGGGLDVDHAVVIEEEIDAYGLTNPPYYDSGGRLGGASILVWGTQEQKFDRFGRFFLLFGKTFCFFVKVLCFFEGKHSQVWERFLK